MRGSREAGHERRRRSGPQPAAAGELIVHCPECHHSIRIDSANARLEEDRIGHQLRLRIDGRRVPLDDVVADVRRTLILDALRKADGVKIEAARLLGMKYSTFWEMAQRLGIFDGDDDGNGDVSVSMQEKIRRISLEIDDDNYPDEITLDIAEADNLMDAAVEGIQRTITTQVLRETDGVLARAAERLGIKYPTFYSMVQRLGIDPRRFKNG